MLGNLWEASKICWLFLMLSKILEHCVLIIWVMRNERKNFQLKPGLMKRKKASAVRVNGPGEIYGWTAFTAHLCSAQTGPCPLDTSCGVARGVPGFGECILLYIACSFVCRLSVSHDHSVMIAFGLFMVSGSGGGGLLINKMHCLPIFQKKAIRHCTELG